MDDLLDSGTRLLFKIIKGFVKSFLYDIVCYAIGWLALRLISIGKYPHEGIGEGMNDPEGRESISSIVGAGIIIAASLWLF